MSSTRLLLTGVGTRVLAAPSSAASTRRVHRRARTDQSPRTRPKPVAVLREWQCPSGHAPEPKHVHELLATLDARRELPLTGARIAVQNMACRIRSCCGPRRARARVTRVRLSVGPADDLAPLEQAISRLPRRVDVVLLTSAIQIVHCSKSQTASRRATCAHASHARSSRPSSDDQRELRRQGLPVDLAGVDPKMGVLVTEAAQRARKFTIKIRNSKLTTILNSERF